MKLKYTFVTNQVADNIVAVAVGESLSEFNGFIKMNDVGADIFEILKNDVTEEEVVAEMCKKYPDTAADEVKEAVAGFIAELKKSDVLE